MATVAQQQPPTGPSSQPPHQQQPQQPSQQQKSPQDPNSASNQLSWDGDRMFNIYIYDYCSKRGFVKTAKELQNEAELSVDSQPPINAKQGLLFEWWSVFWVLFTTKSNGNGPEEALLYTQHQSQQAHARQQRIQQGGHLTFDTIGRQLPPNAQQPVVGPGQTAPGQLAGPAGAQPPMRLPNGVPSRQGPAPAPGPPFMPNGNMANGPLPNGAPGPRINGTGVGGPPFQQSPTMANTPSGGPGGQPGQPGPGPHPGGPPPPQQILQQGGAVGQPPMSQMGPVPQGTMSRPGTSGGLPGGPNGNPGGQMLPPNGPGPVPSTVQPGQQGGMGMPGQTPGPGFGRPPSRTNTPGGGMIMQQSPSLMNRTVPGPGGMVGMGGMSPGNMNMMGGMAPAMASMINVQTELAAVPPTVLKQCKLELGMPDNGQLSEHDKVKLLNHIRMRRQGPPGPANAIAGPSNIRPNIPLPAGQRPPGPPNQQQPPQAGQRAGKRNSTSPGEEHGVLPGQQSDSQSSPRSAKRARHSPGPDQSNQPMYPTQPGHLGHPIPQPGMPGHQPGPGGTPLMNPQTPMHMLRAGPMGGPMMGGTPPGMMIGGPGGPNPALGGPPMGAVNGFAPGMPNGPMAGMMVSPAMSHAQPGGMSSINQYRHNMQIIHKQGMTGNAGSPAAADSPFNPGAPGVPGSGTPRFAPASAPGPGPQQNSQAANNKPMHSMPPPPSPGMKDQNAGAPKDGNGPKTGPGGSPQNQPMGRQTPNAIGGTAPPTPAPLLGGGMNVVGPPPPSTPNPGNPIPAPSPSAMIGVNPPMGAGPPPPSAALGGNPGMDLFSSDFINSVASGLDDFSEGMFRPDGDINFERDFGQWFNGDDATMGGMA